MRWIREAEVSSIPIYHMTLQVTVMTW